MGCVSIILTKQQIHPNQTPSVSWSTQIHSFFVFFFFFCPLQSSLAPWSSTLNSPHVTEISQSLLHAPFNRTNQSINSRKQEYLGEQAVPFNIKNPTQKISYDDDNRWCATNIQFPGGDYASPRSNFPMMMDAPPFSNFLMMMTDVPPICHDQWGFPEVCG